jgi:hypothetical protein
VVRGDVTDDREAEARAARAAAARLVDAIEPLEDPVEITCRDAHAVVGDDELDPGPVRPRRDLHPTARLAVLHRVLHEVADRRDELAPVARDSDGIGGVRDVDADAALVRERGRTVHRAAHDLPSLDAVTCELATQLDP